MEVGGGGGGGFHSIYKKTPVLESLFNEGTNP